MRSIVLCISLLSSSVVFAQASADKDDYTGSKVIYEIGAQIGNLLPNQIPGVTEIMGLGGVRGGFRFAPLTYAEAGVLTGNGNGVEWKNANIDVRMDIPVENLVGFAYVGADTDYYTGSDGVNHFMFGGHAGGGIQTLVTQALWIRGDMKFSFSPGTSLYIGLGFVLRFGEQKIPETSVFCLHHVNKTKCVCPALRSTY